MFGSSSGNDSVWGFVIFFLVLFWMVGWNRNGSANAAGGCGCGDACNNYTTDRDVLKLETAMTAQNALNNAQLETLARTLITNQDKGFASILDGQKDMYIKQLEQQATQMFITNQNEQTRQLITLTSAESEAKNASAACILGHRLDRIESEMLKRPTFEPFGGLPVIGCNNLPRTCGTCCGE